LFSSSSVQTNSSTGPSHTLGKVEKGHNKIKKNYLLGEFFDREENWGKSEIRPKQRPGRSWTIQELRLKSSTDLHKLWYVLIKERNMLLTMQEAYRVRAKIFPCPERIDRVQESMEHLEKVVHERNDSFLLLETGQGASPPMRTITSFMGFTSEEPSREYYDPPEVTRQKEYEVPYLDADAYLMQKLWAEKQHMRKMIETHDRYLNSVHEMDKPLRLRRGLIRNFYRKDQLPENIAQKHQNV